MACMKCGKAAEDGQAFCAHCLEVMEDYPVKPDVHIQLPTRRTEESSKKQTRKSRPRKRGQAASLRKQICWMWAAIVLLILALAFSLGREAVIPAEKAPGQNYTYTEPTT
ncbi:MAG: hypothetical protein IKY18_00860 [Oscillospiraceae bacterium]|nr:hypothetical protein [Oscillospiraceae bacterium]